MDDDIIIKNRLEVDERGLKRLSKRALAIAARTEDSSEDQRLFQSMQMLAYEAQLFEMNLAKVHKMAEVNEGEAEHYREKKKEYLQTIEKEKSRVQFLKVDLLIEKENVKFKEEYDQIANLINKYPTRSELEREIEKFQEETDELVLKQEQVKKLIDSYKVDLSAVFNNLNMKIDEISAELKSRK